MVATATFRGDGRTDGRTESPVGGCQVSAISGRAKPLSHTSSTFQASVCIEVFSSARNYALTFDPPPLKNNNKIIIMVILLRIMLLWLLGLQTNRNKLFNLSQTEDRSFDSLFCASS